MNAITIRTTGNAEISISNETIQPSRLSDLAASEFIQRQEATGHTKLFANGDSADGSDPRTDHVAVIDHATGLMWTAKSMGDEDGEPLPHDAITDRITKLDLFGYDDWRPPTRAELAALVDDTRHEPAIDTSLFPGVLPRWHWTSTPCAWSSASAWYVDFGSGYVANLHRYDGGFALAVRRAGQ
ncbi:hypothetical protein C7E19_04045 [Stenotrophomonas maltophilia]|nr:hypothetical protein C7E19_04045 [Stenotrophomonas maltophilia]